MIKNDLGILKNTFVLNKHWRFQELNKKKWLICFIRGENHQSREQFLSLNYAFVKKPKHPLKWKFGTKIDLEVPDFWNAQSAIYLDYRKTSFWECFFFWKKERPILTALKKMILYEIRQSNGIKPQKFNFSWFFVSFNLTKDFFVVVGKHLQKWSIPFTGNIKNIPSAHRSSTLYLKLSYMFFCCSPFILNNCW